VAALSPIPAVVLDHVAIACDRAAVAWPTFAGALPSSWIGGGGTAGFASFQVSYANGMKVEILEPHLVEQNDFLRRFLDRNGAGPHHLTFKVADIEAALEIVEAAGYRPVGVNLSLPWWKEAFLHPKDAPCIVLQLAQSQDGGDWGDERAPDWFPAPRVPTPATLVHVGHALADVEEGLRLFRDLLGGEVTAEGGDETARFVDLAWPGPGRVRLMTGSAFDSWLDGRTGRVHHIAFATEDPAGVPGAIPIDGTVFHVAPDDLTGTRLLLAPRQEPFRTHALGYVPEHGRTH
jgi:catechol 2,3-dioxygenase-like lactoylglutathione lyase family enzyme